MAECIATDSCSLASQTSKNVAEREGAGDYYRALALSEQDEGILLAWYVAQIVDHFGLLRLA